MHATSTSSSSSSWWPLTSLKSTVIRYHALLLALLASCYLAQAKFDACAPSRRCNVVWNLHIPRTGGMSTHHVVTSLFTPHPIGQNSLANANASPRYAQERRQQLEDISHKLEALILTVQRDPAPLRWMYVYHGVQGGSMDKMLAYVEAWRAKLHIAGCRLVLTTTIRPGSHFAMSRYADLLAHASSHKEKKRLKFDNDLRLDNGMVRYVLNDVHNAETHIPHGGANEAHVQKATDVLGHFNVVGDTRCMALYWRCLARVTGTTLDETRMLPHQNTRGSVPQFTDETHKLMYRHSKQDEHFFMRVQKLSSFVPCKPLTRMRIRPSKTKMPAATEAPYLKGGDKKRTKGVKGELLKARKKVRDNVKHTQHEMDKFLHDKKWSKMEQKAAAIADRVMQGRKAAEEANRTTTTTTTEVPLFEQGDEDGVLLNEAPLIVRAKLKNAEFDEIAKGSPETYKVAKPPSVAPSPDN